jgi:hypothetical protein
MVDKMPVGRGKIGNQLPPLRPLRGSITAVSQRKEETYSFLEDARQRRILPASPPLAFLPLPSTQVPRNVQPPVLPDLRPGRQIPTGIHGHQHTQKYPELQVAPDIEETRLDIIRLAKEVWDELQVDILNNLSDTMPHRVDAVLEAEGWYTSY